MDLLRTMVERNKVAISTLLEFSVLPIVKVLVMCALGFLMATSYVNILSADGRKLLSKLVFRLFLPCLIFTQLGKVVTLHKIIQWWFIPVNVLLSSIVGCLIGVIVVLIIRPPNEFKKFTVVMIGIGNIGNIPLVLIGAVCRSKNNPFGDPQICSEQGVAYISFGQWVGALIVYTFVYHMLAPPQDLDSMKVNHDLESSTPASVPLLADQDDIVGGGTNGSLSYITRGSNRKFFYFIEGILGVMRIKEILQPPIIASVLALTFGTIPILKNLLLVDGAPLFFFSDSLNILGGAMIPCIMLVLGGNLVRGPGSSRLGLRTTVAITFVRLFIVPMAGMGIVFLADKFRFLPENDKMFYFVLLLQHSMPTSILAGAVASLRGVAEKECSAILFWEHIMAVFSMTGWLILYFKILI